MVTNNNFSLRNSVQLFSPFSLFSNLQLPSKDYWLIKGKLFAKSDKITPHKRQHSTLKKLKFPLLFILSPWSKQALELGSIK